MNLNKLNLLSVLVLVLCVTKVNAQTAQDCNGAIPVCQSNYVQNTSYTGVGSTNELNPTNQGCLTTGENNSVWYIVNITQAGTFTFNLTPNSSTDDYDFALWDITDKSCADIANGLPPIRCNYASLANSSANGSTGLNTTSASASLGAGGPSFSSAINVTVGQTFMILINNASASANGYNLNFGGTSSVLDNTPPDIKADTIEAGCNNPSFIKLLLTENIQCSSLATNGSDFSLSPANATISSAISTSCAANANFTNLITVNFSNPLPPGNYTLNVVNGSDANTLVDNCNNSMPLNTSVSFVVQPPVQVNVTTQFGCANTNNGIITASGVNGTSPYQYRLNNGAFANNNVFSGLGAGTYTISIQDVNGCIDDTVVSLAQTAPINITNVTVANPLCFGQNTGSVTITASGGSPPFQYTVNNQPYQNGNTITGLGPGNYIVKVQDANGCIEDSVIFISAPGQLSINNIGITNTTCGQNNGAISGTAFGGTSPLVFSLNNGPTQTSGTFNNLSSGTYTLQVTDGNGCMVDTILNIQQIGAVSITSLNTVQPTCAGGNGSISTNTNGGTSPITYSLNGGTFGASNSFTGLSSGSYTVTAMDANGCTATATAQLSSSANLYYSNAVVVQPTCATTGSISVQGNGGSTPYTFALNTNPYAATSSWNNLGAGTYTIHLLDANNCLHDTIITLTQTQSPVFTTVPTSNPSCSFPNAGSITANVTGGTPAYSFQLNGAAASANNAWSNLTAGVYTITVTDANGCTITTTRTLTQPNTIAFSQFTRTHIGCFGTPQGAINTSATNGNAPYQFSLNGGAPQNTGNFNNLGAGTYTVVVTDASGCTTSSVTTINTSAVVTMNSLNFTNSPCFNPATGTITVNGTVSNPPITYNINPGPSNTTGNFGGLAPGTYTVIVSDAAGCSVTSSVVLIAPPPLFYINVQVVIPPCYGGIGSISVQGAGGTPPYQYQINNGGYGNTSSWGNLPAGTYQVSLQDANGCINDTSITIIEPPEINISGLVISNASCNNAPTGSATITATGGTPPFTYSINNGPYSANNVFNNLGPGSTTISVQDSNGCIEDTVIIILANGNFSITAVSLTQPDCFGDNNGVISFSALGGVPPYQFRINGGAFQASNVFNNLSAGTYTLRAIDGSGCLYDSIVTLGQPTSISFANINSNNPGCNGDSSGSIIVSGSGGTSPYTYSKNNGVYTSSGNLNNLSAGVNTISVQDANGCIFDTTIILVNPPAIGFNNISIIDAGCLGGGGVISYIGLGGTSPYSYSINGINYQGIGQFTGLNPGSYTVYVRDANNCVQDTVLTVGGSAVITINSFNYPNYLCTGANNGTISVTATSANTPMSFNINAGPNQPTGVFNNLVAGTYTIHIEDNLGCFIDSVVTIQQAPLINIDSLNLTNATCANTNNGGIIVYASGGVNPLAYRLNLNGYQTSNSFNNVFGSTYTITVRDSVNCTVDTVINIAVPPAIVVDSINITQPFCNTATDGQIAINASGGVPPYLYAINTSLYTTNNVFSNLIQGVYTVHILDANNCLLDTVVNLVANNYMQFANIVIQNVSCVSGNNGSITLSTNGGVFPYSYTINNISNGPSGSFTNLGTGNYTIVVTDNIGCQQDTVLPISQPANPLSLQLLQMTPNLCKGDSAGNISLGGLGGTPPYQFSMDGTSYQTNGNYGQLAAGFYQVYIQDANGCIYDSIVQVTEPDSSVQLVLLGVTPQSCVGVDDGTITVTSQFGTSPYNFFFDGQPVGTDTFYNLLAPGDYVVEVVDGIGCKSTGKYIVAPSTIRPFISIDSMRTVLCNGDTDGFISWFTTSPYPPFDYTFNTSPIGATNSADNLSNGTYIIEVVDDRGCTADTTVILEETNKIELSINTTPAACEGLGDDGGARAIVIGGVGPYRFSWSSNFGITTDSIFPVNYGTYYASVFDANNCSDTAAYTIEYDPCCVVTLPNAFTPNNDGLNDVFRVIKFGQIELESFVVYNRWGNKVFETKILTDKWDGTYKGEYCELGTYFYHMTYKCPLNDNIEEKRGDVTLIR